jgi:hypothetical protein
VSHASKSLSRIAHSGNAYLILRNHSDRVGVILERVLELGVVRAG